MSGGVETERGPGGLQLMKRGGADLLEKKKRAKSIAWNEILFLKLDQKVQRGEAWALGGGGM